MRGGGGGGDPMINFLSVFVFVLCGSVSLLPKPYLQKNLSHFLLELDCRDMNSLCTVKESAAKCVVLALNINYRYPVHPGR